MDQVIIEVFTRMSLAVGCSADDVLESPELRQEFLDGVRRVLGGHLPEQQLLHRLTTLRKARRLPRSRDLQANDSSPV